MTTKDLIASLGLKALSQFEPRDITGVFVSDMMSDAMANAKSGDLWVTVQTHKSIVPAANLVDVAAIIVTSGKHVPDETVELANKHGIAVLSTPMMTFELVGKLYGLGLVAK